MKNTELCVPVNSLKLPGEGGDVAPGVGDEGDAQVTYRVARLEGEKAYIEIASVNGEPVESAGPKKPASLDDEEDTMRAEAEKSDAAAIY